MTAELIKFNWNLSSPVNEYMLNEKAPKEALSLIWLRGQDSNLRPRGYEPRELPLLHPASDGSSV